MILGTVVGVAQTSVKRMLAYSSIAHAGYLLVGLVAASTAGKAAILFYLVAYARDQPRRLRRARGALDGRSAARRHPRLRRPLARAARAGRRC